MSLKDTFRQLAKCVLIRHCEWNGMKIRIDYKPSWFLVLRRIYGYDLSHLQIRTIAPEGEPLPITKTGYTTMIEYRTEIDAAGGPEAYVLEQIAIRERSPEYKAEQEAARQGDLFAFMKEEK